MSDPVKQLVEKLNGEWVAFQAEHARQIKELKAGVKDPLTEEKINKASASIGEIQAQLDALQTKVQRKGTGGAEDPKAEAKAAHRKGFEAFLRSGADEGLGELQAAVSIGSDPDGGYAVPETIDTEIEKYERDNTPMRSLCRVITVSSENYEKLINKGGASSGWVDELEARPETNTPTLAALKPYFGEIYANPGASQKSLDDPMFSVEQWLSEEVGIEFGEQENDAFTKGTGIKKPKGILGYTLSTAVDGTRTFGEIQKVNSGVSGGFAADKILDLIYSMKRGYRNGAVMMLSALGVGELRKLKDGQNNYLWQPSYVAGTPQMLAGYPIEENDDVPDPAAGANALIFANFRRAYYIVDVRGTRVLRDPFTNKPKVHFYTTKRVGGFVVNDRAVKVLTLT